MLSIGPTVPLCSSSPLTFSDGASGCRDIAGGPLEMLLQLCIGCSERWLLCFCFQILMVGGGGGGGGGGIRGRGGGGGDVGGIHKVNIRLENVVGYFWGTRCSRFFWSVKSMTVITYQWIYFSAYAYIGTHGCMYFGLTLFSGFLLYISLSIISDHAFSWDVYFTWILAQVPHVLCVCLHCKSKPVWVLYRR